MRKILLGFGSVILVCSVYSLLAIGARARQKAATGADATDEAEAIRKLSDEYGAATTAGDVDRFVNLLTDDAIMMPPGRQMITGKETIRNWIQPIIGNMKNAGREEATTPSEITISGDWAFDLGATTFKVKGEPAEGTNKYIRIWHKAAKGSWKLARVIWNGNSPGK